MARVFKRPGSDFYYGRFKLDGKEVWFSTKSTDRKEAQEIADGKMKAARGKVNTDDYFAGLTGLLARLSKDDQDAKRHEYARRLMAGQSSTLLIKDAWQAWNDTPLKGNPSAITIRSYESMWRRFLQWITDHKTEHLHEITETHAQDYISDLWKSGIAPRTFNGHVQFLKSMFAALRVKAGLVSNVWDNIKTMAKETQGRENFTPEELAVICAKATGSFRYMIGLGLYTGMRLGDVVNLKWKNIGKDSIKIIPSKTKRKGKQITLPIHPVLRALLNELRKQAGNNEYLFPAERKIHAKDSTLAKHFQQFLNDCGIKTQEAGGLHRRKAIVRKGFHSLRHSFVSLCAANRVPQVAIQDLVGHGSPAMTELYSHADFQQKQDAIATLPAIAFSNNKQERKQKKVKGKDKHPVG